MVDYAQYVKTGMVHRVDCGLVPKGGDSPGWRFLPSYLDLDVAALEHEHPKGRKAPICRRCRAKEPN